VVVSDNFAGSTAGRVIFWQDHDEGWQSERVYFCIIQMPPNFKNGRSDYVFNNNATAIEACPGH
jgi:hypothetical protein